MRILIRADASTVTGTGHVMRCLALAQALHRLGSTITFAHSETTPALSARLMSAGFANVPVTATIGSMEDAIQTIALARQHAAHWIIADGYHFNAAFQQAIHAAGFRLLLITDVPFHDPITADLVLNQNLPAQPRDYPRIAPHTRRLLGTRYTLFRPEFFPWREKAHAIREPGRRILITLGGSDPDNVTGCLLDALSSLPEIEITVVIGGSNPHRAKLEARSVSAPGRIQCIIDAKDMPALMDRADVAVAAGGSTCWELALLGVPAALVVLADNQTAGAAALQAENAALLLGPAAELDSARVAREVGALLADARRRRALSERSRQLVDGLGVHRVIAVLQTAQLDLRPAATADCRLVWEWANTPEVRAASFRSEPIPWDAHVAWFNRLLASPASQLFLASLDGIPVGQIRFEPALNGAVVSVGLAPGQRGRGLGPALIRAGCERHFATSATGRINAYTRPENQASVRAFEKAGFACLGRASLGTGPAIHLILERETP